MSYLLDSGWSSVEPLFSEDEKTYPMTEIECEQRKLCKVYNADYYPCPYLQKIGIASNIESGIFPINGLRHLPVGDACGWYLWAGGEIDESSDFFHPVHVVHLNNSFPSLLKFLG